MSANEQIINDLVTRYGRDRTALLPVLQGVVEKNNYLTEEDMSLIAKELDISGAQVFGTATFYSFLDHVPRGRYIIRICRTISCDMKNKDEIVRAIEKMLKIKPGETTDDKKFTLLYTNCMGWCDKGPSMLINDTPYAELTAEKVQSIIKDYMHREN